MKGRKIANRPGLTKKRIRGKDGKTRTHWVKAGAPSAPPDRSRRRKAAAIALGSTAAASAIALGSYLALKRGIETVRADTRDFFWPQGEEDQAEVERIYSQFEPGDLIERCFTVDLKVSEYAAKHYAVYMGRDARTGQHMILNTRKEEDKASIVVIEPIDAGGVAGAPPNARRSAYQKVTVPPPTQAEIDAGAPRSREEILERASQISGTYQTYDILKSNCESVARGIVQGRAFSEQGERRDLLVQIGGTIVNAGAAIVNRPGSVSADEITERANRFTLSRRGRIDSVDPADIPGSVDRLLAQVDRMTGSVANEVKTKLISEWLISMALGGDRVEPAVLTMDSKSKICPGGYKIPVSKKCKGTGGKLGQAKKNLRNAVLANPIGATGLGLAATGGVAALAKPHVEAGVRNVGKAAEGYIRERIGEAASGIARNIEGLEKNEFAEEQIGKITGALGRRAKKEIEAAVSEKVAAPGKAVRERVGQVGEAIQGLDQKGREVARKTWQGITGAIGGKGKGSAKTDAVYSACQEIRSDAAQKGTKCGKSYISKSKKCKRGLGAGGQAQSGSLSSPSTPESTTATGALQVANQRGFLGKIAVNKDDFDWPGNGRTTPEIEARYNTFKKGDLIENAFQSQGGKYVRHYGVYGGKDPKTGQHLVYQVGRKEDGSGQEIKKESLSAKKPIEFSAWRQTSKEEMRQKSNLRPLSRSEIIKRAEATVGKDFHYNLARSNCEHYARGVVEGSAYSAQMEKTSLLTRMAGDIISVGVRKKLGKNGLSASEITSMINQIESKQGRSVATRKELYMVGRRDAVGDASLGDLRSPAEFEQIVSRMTSSMPGTAGDLLREELYTNYLMMITKMLSGGESRQDAKSKTCPGGYKISSRKQCRTKGRTGKGSSNLGGKLKTARSRFLAMASPENIAGAAVAGMGAIGTARNIVEAATWVDNTITEANNKRKEYKEASPETREEASRRSREEWEASRKAGKSITQSMGNAQSVYRETLRGARKEAEPERPDQSSKEKET